VQIILNLKIIVMSSLNLNSFSSFSSFCSSTSSSIFIFNSSNLLNFLRNFNLIQKIYLYLHMNYCNFMMNFKLLCMFLLKSNLIFMQLVKILYFFFIFDFWKINCKFLKNLKIFEIFGYIKDSSLMILSLLSFSIQ